MADKNVIKNRMADRRRRRVRGKVAGTAGRPRLTVCRSLNNVIVQVIDDVNRVTLVGLASNSQAMKDALAEGDNKTIAAKKLGLKVAELARAKGIEQVVFDRNHHVYHGRVKAVADGAREGGLKF
ncbi:MAG: 50S ribosomal protein L18 [candidate division Zixibacteria bacterium]|nr:50S ribosomal protein L18 [candidate division Zixibacteria bacterium]